MGPIGLEAFRYHAFANAKLFDAVGSLTDEQLQLTTPGTYGTMAATLQHLVSTQQRYIEMLRGGSPQDEEPGEFPGLEHLREQMARSDAELVEIVEQVGPGEIVEGFDKDRVQAGVVMIQALHHGNDHRTHVCSILGAHGFAYPDMQVWAYGFDKGFLVPVE